MGEWIDFRQLRERLDFAEVLKHYGATLKPGPANQHKGRCPLPSHPKANDSLCFSANLKKKIWRCFGCGASGNVLDFAVCMEGGNPKVPADVRRVALLLQEHFGGTTRNSNQRARQEAPSCRNEWSSPVRESPPKNAARTLVNAPLDFKLKNLSTDHAFFRKRRLLQPTIEHFGVGYCTKGLFAGRIVIPLHDFAGKLVGYVGKLPDEVEVTDSQPLYLWPEKRERNGTTLVFDRKLLLYHAEGTTEPITDLVVVQWPESAWAVWQAGFSHVVAIMGDAPSPEQSEAIIERVLPTGRIWILTDGTKVGDRCAEALFFDLGPHRFCKWIKLQSGSPQDLDAETLKKLLSWRM